MKIFTTAHADAQKILWRAVWTASVLILLFQIATTGWFLFTQSGGERWILFWAGCGLGFVIAALEYATVEGLRDQWQQTIVDGKITRWEWLLLLGIVLLLTVVAFVDTYATANGALQLGFSNTISWIWAVGQLFAFEFLFNMAYHLRDVCEVQH
ncbi:MAG: hypothetical protein WC596_01965 [Candidatus Shapirobacteria bacterium]